MGDLLCRKGRVFLPLLSVSYLLLTLLNGCGGLSKEGPVNLPVPFSGAMDSDSRVVVVDGGPLGSGALLKSSKFQQNKPGCAAFPAVDANGHAIGECEYCQNSEAVASSFILDGRRKDHFTIPVRCMDNGDIVSAEVECLDFPHPDETIAVASFVPPGEFAELRSGICSGVILFGDGTFMSSPENGLMTGKYVTISKLEGGKKTYFHHLQWVWVIDR